MGASRVNAIIAQQRRKDDNNSERETTASYENVEEERAARNPLDVTAAQEEGGSRDLWLLPGVDAKTRM
jgi:hypothetical protein